MPNSGDVFDLSKWSFDEGPDLADCFVPPLFLDWERLSSNGSVHGLVRGCPWMPVVFHPIISLVSINGLSCLREINPAIMYRGRGGIEASDDLMILVDEDMEFVSEI